MENEGTPQDAVAATIELALFEEKPKPRYMVVPEQRAAGWVMLSLMSELLELNAHRDYSYTRDDLVTLLDALSPFAEGENSFDNEEDEAELRQFYVAWAKREDKNAK